LFAEELGPLPKSDTPSRIVENADVYNFELSKEEMRKLDGLDQGTGGAIVKLHDYEVVFLLD
jgi:diketogulonate reductase-like aldo/keto reductase